MKKLRYIFYSLTGALLISTSTKAQSVYQIIANSPDHDTLELAIIQAGLVSALNDPTASLTVFAPTDSAFKVALNKLGMSAQDLLQSQSLDSILLYHVLGFKVLSTDLSNGLLASPLNLVNNLKVTLDGNNVFVNQAKVTNADLPADNGVVHVLDGVVLPKQTVADIIINSPNHITLFDAIKEAKLLPCTDQSIRYLNCIRTNRRCICSSFGFS